MRKPNYVRCSGAAHSNAYIDHCYVCIPYWGKYPVCVDCGTKLVRGEKLYQCPKCRKRFKD